LPTAPSLRDVDQSDSCSHHRYLFLTEQQTIVHLVPVYQSWSTSMRELRHFITGMGIS